MIFFRDTGTFRTDPFTCAQETLAELVGVIRNTIISPGKDKYCPSLKPGYRIAQTFSMGIDEVFFCEEDKDGLSADKG